jgi:hypothetical protein
MPTTSTPRISPKVIFCWRTASGIAHDSADRSPREAGRFFLMVNISLTGGHPMFKSSLKISLIAFAVALVALPLGAATLVALTLF